MKTIHFILGLWLAGATETAWPQTSVVLENAHFRYTISPAGKNLSFIDCATGIDYLRSGAPSPCALVRRRGKEYAASAVALTDSRLTMQFKEAGIEAVLTVEQQPSYIRLTVTSVQGGNIDSLVFINIPLSLQGKPGEPFGACALSLNLQTRVDQLPALQTELRASSYQKFGLTGAKVALIGMPMKDMLAALKDALTNTNEMPLCRVGGPWARETPFNHGSYLFNFGSLTESIVEDWIGMTKDLGVTQIDNHGGGAFFRFGDFELNRQKWPDGWEAFQRINARLHSAGVGSIFHTYGFFIDKHSRYVTPVPDARLDAFRAFTLSEAIGPDANEIRVNESTAGMSTVTGFFVHNSVVLHLGDELVTFAGFSTAPPWRFTGVKRGVLGTHAASHRQGAPARHLKECFGLFVPNPESTLFEEIAVRHAEVVNQCDFDGIYLDAIDGSSILRGGDECWYWADKFVFEIQKRLKKPVGMEMSAMWHHFWQYRTRWQAWDYPQRGHERFIDLHAEAVNGGLLLPLHFGWWNFQSFNPPQVEPTYPEVMEYLGAKLIGWDAGISLTGAIDRERLRTVPLFRRAVDILRTCEELRHANVLNDEVKANLRAPGKEFSLFANADGKPRFRRLHSEKHTVTLAEPWTLAWHVTNEFAEQPVRFRLEALMSVASYDHPDAKVIADLSGQDSAQWNSTAAVGVTFSCAPASNAPMPGAAELTAFNSGKVQRNAAWGRFAKRFTPPANLKGHEALGMWIDGDSRGELVAIRLESPEHLAFGAIADRYLKIDFSGPRFVTLVETESARWNDYVWNDGKSAYNVYRETIDFSAIESVGVWYQNLTPGQEIKCRVGPVKALPMMSGQVKESMITVNGMTLVLPVELTSGSWIECRGTNDCTHYGPNGERLGQVTPRGTWPVMHSGDNEARFSCGQAGLPSPRAKVTFFNHGEEL